MTYALVWNWLEKGGLDLPLPGGGATVERWQRLTELTEADVAAGRLAEAHCDAVAILAELKGPDTHPGEFWGVWAAEAPGAALSAEVDGDKASLEGTKVWCSGAGLCTHALVTARLASGVRGLFAVELGHPGVTVLPNTWRNSGMAESQTRSVQFSAVPAVMVGEPGDYLTRPGFWHGAIGVAACWLGGARAVAAPLYARAGDEHADAHALAHLGAVDAALTAADATLTAAAAHVDGDPADRSGQGEMWALRTRTVAETAVTESLNRTARALGPAPLCQDATHASRVADLTIYVRQSHAEKDLEQLGRLAGGRR